MTTTPPDQQSAEGGLKMAAKHTPGPWRVVPYDAGDVDHWAGMPSVVAPDECDCAIVHWDGFAQRHWRSARGDAEILANARLIASAPALLEALKELLSGHDNLYVAHFGPGSDPQNDIAAKAARAAIRQAEGGE